jgi:integrase
MRPTGNDLTRGEFLFLGALLDGQPRTFQEIKSAASDWNIRQAQFAKYVRHHGRYGWIERGRFAGVIVCKGDPHRQTRSAYRITDAGRRTWQESADWWLFQIQSAQRPGQQGLELKPDFTVAPLAYAKPRPDQVVTADDLDRALRDAEPRFAIFCRALATGQPFDRLQTLRVEDVDQAGARMRIAIEGGRPQRVPISADMLPLISEAIGDRQTGWVFCHSRGGQWRPQRVSTLFARLRRKAGLPAGLKLRGRLDKQTREKLRPTG